MSTVSHLVINLFFRKITQIIRNTHSNLNVIQLTVHKMPTSFLGSHLFKISSVSHLVFNEFFPEVNQIIRNTQRTTTSNLNVIQPMDHMISCPQAFLAGHLGLYAKKYICWYACGGGRNGKMLNTKSILIYAFISLHSELNRIHQTMHL